MNNFVKFFLIIIFIFVNACKTNNEVKKIAIEDKDLDFQMIEAYQEGLKLLEENNFLMLQKNLMKQKFYILNHYGLLEHH